MFLANFDIQHQIFHMDSLFNGLIRQKIQSTENKQHKYRLHRMPLRPHHLPHGLQHPLHFPIVKRTSNHYIRHCKGKQGLVCIKRDKKKQFFWIRYWFHIATHLVLLLVGATTWKPKALSYQIGSGRKLTGYLLESICIEWRSLISDMTLYFQDGGRDIILRKSLRLLRFKSDRDEIWHDCSSSE